MPKKPQIDKFKEAARKIGADVSEADFNDALRGLAKPERGGGGQRRAGGQPVRSGGKRSGSKKRS